MALPTSGPLTLAQIQTEFGGSNPISLNEYYAGGANVPAGTSGTNGAVPSSGTISISNFYGTQKVAPTFSFSISAHQDRANLRSLAVAAGWNQSAPVVATLTGGYYIYSTVDGSAALTINGSWPGGVTFVNNGYVMGKGGQGGGFYQVTAPGGAVTQTANYLQSAGSTAISLGVSCTITNNSYIGGGGGGGGATKSNFGTAGGGAGGGAGGAVRLRNENVSPVTDTTTAGGTGGGIGSSGGNGSSGAGGLIAGGGGGRIMPGTNTVLTTNTGGITLISTGGGAGNAGSSSVSGVPNAIGSQVGGLGGSGGGTGGQYTYFYGGSGTSYNGGGGGGWGASGGASSSSIAGSGGGAAGGNCVALNGYSLTWAATGTRYGAIS